MNNLQLDKEKGFLFLDWLRENGAAMWTNRGFHLMKQFGCSKQLADSIQLEWAKALSTRIKHGEIVKHAPRRYSEMYKKWMRSHFLSDDEWMKKTA